MSDLASLYQEVILDHYRNPRNHSALGSANRTADGHNPLCGDRVKVFLHVDGGVVRDAAFEGSGCAISTASASLMTEAVKGKSVEEVEALFQRFRHLLTADESGGESGENGRETAGAGADLGKLEVLSGVRDYPMRVKCATLAWHTLHAALARRVETATTE